MKTSPCSATLALLLGLTITGSLFATTPTPTPPPAPASAPDARVTVIFAHPEKYMDVMEDDFDQDNERGGEHYFPLLKEHIETVAGRTMAPGQKLTITFTDIDLAGEFEPWRGPQLSNVRIVKDIYSPRLTFTFRLTDESGRVVKEGERKLSDLTYQMRITTAFPDDLLRYEKDLLNDWISSELKPLKS